MKWRSLGNGNTDLKADEVEVDVILLSHGHNDHVGDTVELAKKHDALVVAPFERRYRKNHIISM